MPNHAAPLRLDTFLPYRLSVLTNTVSRAIARIYAERFGVTVAEWRVMAVLGIGGGLSANEVVARTAMDKVRVSRAVGGMVSRGLVARHRDDRDRRRSVLHLSLDGRRIYDRIVPAARSVEARLLTALNDAEKRQLHKLLDKLQGRADVLNTKL